MYSPFQPTNVFLPNMSTNLFFDVNNDKYSCKEMLKLKYIIMVSLP